MDVCIIRTLVTCVYTRHIYIYMTHVTCDIYAVQGIYLRHMGEMGEVGERWGI